MLMVSQEQLNHMEKQYPGIAREIDRFENANLPSCPKCNSPDTSAVKVGIIGRSINAALATTKVKLVPNGGLGKYFCNACDSFFDKSVPGEPEADKEE